jgi:RecA-family ATPase
VTLYVGSEAARARGETPEDWLVEDLLPRGQLVILAAPAKHGKTTLAVQLCDALERGVPFLGKPIPKPVRTLVLEADMSDRMWERAWFHDYAALHPSAVTCETCRPHYLTDLGTGPNVDLLGAAERRRVKQVVHTRKPEFVVVDALETSVSYSWNLNELSGARRAMVALRDVCGLDTTILVLHHIRKPPSEGDEAIHSVAGHHALTASADAVWVLTKAGDHGGTLVGKGRAVGWAKLALRLHVVPVGPGHTSRVWAVKDAPSCAQVPPPAVSAALRRAGVSRPAPARGSGT